MVTANAAEPERGRSERFAGRDPWLDRRTSLRNLVRQELVRRRLAELDLGAGATALDVGAGQGTQAIALARQGVRVVALEPDPAMRDACRAALDDEPMEVRERVELVAGALHDLPPGPGGDPDDTDGPDSRGGGPTRTGDPPGRYGLLGATHDLVTCHGVLLYLADPRDAVARLAARVGPRGALSLLSRNASAIAVRPLLRGRWEDVEAALDELDRAAAAGERPHYRNEIGVEAHGDDVEAIISWLDATGGWTHSWTGVRLASDALEVDRPAPADDDLLHRLVDLEERLGRSGPYRRIASLFHLVSRRTTVGA